MQVQPQALASADPAILRRTAVDCQIRPYGVADQAVLATLIYRLASYWLPMPTGAVAYALFTHRYGRTKVARLNGGGKRGRSS